MVFIILILVSLWNARRIVVIEEVPGELVPFGSLAVFVVRWGLVGGHWVGGGCRLGLWYTAGHLHEFICGIAHVVTIMVQTKRVCHIEFFSLFSKKLVLFYVPIPGKYGVFSIIIMRICTTNFRLSLTMFWRISSLFLKTEFDLNIHFYRYIIIWLAQSCKEKIPITPS